MHCPNCSHTLEATTPAPLLSGYRCPQQHGLWLDLGYYRHWLASNGGKVAEAPAADSLPVEDQTRALPCPHCARLMQKYRLAHEHAHRVDRCTHCQGVWFDHGEWEKLVEQGRHADLLSILSDRGQKEIRDADSRMRLDEHFRRRFGDDSYAELRRIRSWLATQERRREMLAFLQTDEQG